MKIVLARFLKHHAQKCQPRIGAEKEMWTKTFMNSPLQHAPPVGDEIMDRDYSYTVGRVLHDIRDGSLEVWVNDAWSFGYGTPNRVAVVQELERAGWKHGL